MVNALVLSDGVFPTLTQRPANILVFGHDGQLSRAIRNAERPQNWRVTCLGRAQANIADAMQVRDAIGRIDPDVIINTAAYTNVDAAESNKAEAYAINCDGAANVAKAAAERSVPLLHISTDFVFSGDKNEAYVELDPVGPINVYGASKEAGECAVREVCLRHAIVRTSWLYSAGEGNFVTSIIRHLTQSDTISVVQDQTGSPTFSADLASALIAMSSHMLQPQDHHFGTFHAAGRGSVSRLDFAREIQSEMTRAAGANWSGAACRIVPSLSVHQNAAAVRPTASSLNCDKLQDCFGIEMPEWKMSLRRCVEGVVKQGS